MQYTENFSLRKPQYADPADVADLNYNFDEIDDILLYNRLISAEGYDITKTYNTGNLAVYENVLYKCLEDNVTGVWDSTKWTATNLANEIGNGSGGASSLDDLTDVDITTPSDGQALIYDDTNDEWVNADLPAVTKTVEGNPVEFEDGADAPLVKCVSEIQGSQDLHGQTHPWIGGAGKNKLYTMEDRIKSVNTSGTWTGNVYVHNGLTFELLIEDGNVTGIKVTGTATANEVFIITRSPQDDLTLAEGNYVLSGCPSGGSASTYYVGINHNGVSYGYDTGNELAFTVTAGQVSDIIGCWIGVQNGYSIPTNGYIFNLMVRTSGESATFAPYSNKSPITSYNEGSVKGRGKNILSYDNIGINWDGTNIPKRIWASFEVPPGKYTYHVKTNNLISEGKVGVGKYPIPMTQAQWDESGSRSMYEIGSGGTKTVTTDSVGKYLLIGFISNSASITEEELEAIELQCEAGESFTSYEKPNHTTHTTTYPDAIYQGEEDVVNGSVKSTWKKVVITTFYGNPESNGFRCGNILPDIKNAYGGIICNIFDAAHSYVESVNEYDSPADRNKIGYNSNGTILLNCYVNGHYLTTIAELNAILPPEGCVIAYETIENTSPVTPSNLPIKSLSGYNHIESSTGDLEVEYITKDEQAIIDLIPSGGRVYSTTPQVVGTWIDGSDIYEVVWHNEFDFWTIPASTASTNFLTISSPQLPYGCVIISAVAIHGVPVHGAGGGTQISPVAITCPNSNSNCDVRQFLTFDFDAKDIIIQYIVPSNSLNLSRSEISEGNMKAVETPIEEEKPVENDLDEWLEDSEEIEEEVDEGTDEDSEEEEEPEEDER